MSTTEEIRKRLEKAFGKRQAGVLAEVLAGAYEELASVRDFGEVKEALKVLAQAQARTEEHLARLEAAVERLAQAQAKAEERISRLEAAVSRLEAAVERLAEAQARTERAVQELAQAVGRLSDTVGYGLEDIARVILPGYLERHLGIQVEELERRFVGPEDQEIEVNLYGEGKEDGQRVVILGEVKSRIYRREVEEFDRAMEKVTAALTGKVVKVMVGYLIHPSASRLASERAILLVASYQR